MNSSRRNFLKTSTLALLGPSGGVNTSGVKEALSGGYGWKEIAGTGSSYDMILHFLSEGKRTHKKIANIACLKVLLRDIVLSRKMSAPRLHPVELEREKAHVREIQEHSCPNLIERLVKDKDFLSGFTHESMLERLELYSIELEEEFIQQQLTDLNRLVKLTESELDTEYNSRTLSVIQESFQVVINQLIGITSGSRGFHLTCKPPFTWQVADAVRVIMSRDMPSGVYANWNSLKGAPSKVSISSGRIESISLATKKGVYVNPRDDGKEWGFIEE